MAGATCTLVDANDVITYFRMSQTHSKKFVTQSQISDGGWETKRRCKIREDAKDRFRKPASHVEDKLNPEEK